MWIVSNDTVLAEALQVALRSAGMEAEILSTLPSRIGESDGFILDLDSIPPTASLPSPSVTFARTLRPRVDLVRPFLFRELIDIARSRFGAASSPAFVGRAPVSPDVPLLKLTPNGVLLQGAHVDLSPAEHALLTLLMEHPGECVSGEQIDALWQEKGGNTTAVYIRYLRKKIDEPLGLRLIRTVRGRGYCLCLPQ